jgi:hypothetical protein
MRFRFFCLRYEPVAGSCKHGSAPSDFAEDFECLDTLNDRQFLKDSVPLTQPLSCNNGSSKGYN